MAAFVSGLGLYRIATARTSPSLIQLYIDNNEIVRCKGLLENGLQFFGLRYPDASGAIELGQSRGGGNEELGADDTAAVGFHLVAFHAAIGIVAQDQNKDWNLVVARGGELLLLHHERAVAGDADHSSFGASEFDSHRCRQRCADGAELAGMDDRCE